MKEMGGVCVGQETLRGIDDEKVIHECVIVRLARLAEPAQKLCRRDDRNSLAGIEYQEIVVSCDNDIGPTFDRHFEELVVLRVAADREAVGWLQRFTPQKDQTQESLHVVVRDAVLVPHSRTCEDVYDLLENGIGIESQVAAVTQGLQNRTDRARGFDQRPDQDTGVEDDPSQARFVPRRCLLQPLGH